MASLRTLDMDMLIFSKSLLQYSLSNTRTHNSRTVVHKVQCLFGLGRRRFANNQIMNRSQAIGQDGSLYDDKSLRSVRGTIAAVHESDFAIVALATPISYCIMKRLLASLACEECSRMYPPEMPD